MRLVEVPDATLNGSVAACLRAILERDDVPVPPQDHPEPFTVWRSWLGAAGLGLVPIADPARSTGRARGWRCCGGGRPSPSARRRGSSGTRRGETFERSTRLPARARRRRAVGAPGPAVQTHARARRGIAVARRRGADVRLDAPSPSPGAASRATATRAARGPSPRQARRHDLTLIEAEEIDARNSPRAADRARGRAAQHVTRGIDLNALVGRRVQRRRGRVRRPAPVRAVRAPRTAHRARHAARPRPPRRPARRPPQRRRDPRRRRDQTVGLGSICVAAIGAVRRWRASRRAGAAACSASPGAPRSSSMAAYSRRTISNIESMPPSALRAIAVSKCAAAASKSPKVGEQPEEALGGAEAGRLPDLHVAVAVREQQRRRASRARAASPSSAHASRARPSRRTRTCRAGSRRSRPRRALEDAAAGLALAGQQVGERERRAG